MNYTWDSNLQHFITAFIRLWILCGIQTYSVSLQFSLDYELHVGFEPAAFHKDNCGRLWITCGIWIYNLSQRVQLWQIMNYVWDLNLQRFITAFIR